MLQSKLSVRSLDVGDGGSGSEVEGGVWVDVLRWGFWHILHFCNGGANV